MVPRWLARTCEHIRDDRAIILAAVQANGHSLQYASEACKGDTEIVLAAMDEALEWGDPRDVRKIFARVSKVAKRNKEVILFLVQVNGLSLKYASKGHKNNKKIVLAAVEQNFNSIRYANPTMRADIDINRAVRLGRFQMEMEYVMM